MDLTSDHPLWLLRHGLLTVVPSLTRDLDCEVLVVGAGITGALVAHRLSEAGIDCAVIDRRDLGQGSTCASTALLQYDIDVPLVELREQIGPERAARAYNAGVEAIDALSTLCRDIPDAAFERRPSLYFTSDSDDTDFLRSELDARAAAGLEVRWSDPDELRGRWGLAAAGAIHSAIAAQADPYRLTHALLRRCIDRGVSVHDRTTVLDLAEHADAVTLRTERALIRARWVVMATGYESVRWLPKKIVTLHSTYALATEPLDPARIPPDRPLIWEHADPYRYARWTDDDRLLFGGRDEPFKNETLRDRLLARKADQLRADLAATLPGLAAETAFAWAGTFGSTKDGLGYIGAPPDRRRVLFALGFGGNGITYSEIASRILTDTVQGRPHPDSDLFAFGRA
jgi:glycine/D-amino acid oxidase-like deaminating enzyme